jgi:hypothetical protein
LLIENRETLFGKAAMLESRYYYGAAAPRASWVLGADTGAERVENGAEAERILMLVSESRITCSRRYRSLVP